MTVSKLHRWLSGQTRTAITPHKRPSKLRPRLELMEDRVVPATFVVNNLADTLAAGTLRSAITAANAAAGADTIDASALSGTISLLTELPTITDDTNIIGSGASTLTVQRDPGAATDFRIFFVDNGARLITVNFTGLTISGGRADRGGGIRIPYERTTITNCVISGNTATAGVGGGIDSRADTDMTIINSTLSGNSATGNGGGFYAGYNGRFLMTGSTVSGNTSGGDGGGLYFFAYSTTTTWVVKNSTISGNNATGNGGGIGLIGHDQHTTIQNSTITNNTAGGAGGGFATTQIGTGGPDVTVLESSIISGNTSSVADISTPGTGSIQNCAIGVNSGFTFTNNGGNIFGASLLLGPLANNGGPTQSHLPGAGSPVINAGINAVFQGIDQRGLTRTAGTQVDIGAVETGATQPAGNIPGVGIVTAFAATSYQIQVTYTDPTGINVGSIDQNDITVTGPSGAAMVNPNPTVSGSGATVVATYTITPPGGTFDLADNGFFTVSSVLNQVTDTGGNGITAGIIGRFQVVLIAVTNTNDSGAGSLRQAILDSNASVGLTNTIGFAIGTGPATISPTSQLPALSDPVILDATTQPGFAGTPIVELAGNLAAAGAIGLDVGGANSVIRGLVINRWATGVAIGGANAVVQGNYIGTNLAGTAASANGVGVFMAGANGALIGSDLNGTGDAAERNVISGNSVAGVRGGGASAAVTVAQWTTGVGANNHYYVRSTQSVSWVAAEALAASLGGHLASVGSAEENAFLLSLGTGWMGMTDDTAYGGTEFGNTSGAANRGEGFVWTDGTLAPYPTGYQNWGNGQPDDANGEDYAEMVGGGTWNDLPGSFTRPALAEFTTAPNIQAIVAALGVVPNRVQGNYIGTDAAGSAAVGNAAGVVMGGSLGDTVRGNVISGNTGSGIAVSSTAVAGLNNHYYVLSSSALTWVDAEALAVANGGHLVSISGSTENAIALGVGIGWIGLTDDPAYGGTEFGNTGAAPNRGEGWVWTDGTPAPYPVGGPLSGYQNWGGPQPDNANGENFAEIVADGTWNDLPASFTRQGVMEFTSPPSPALLPANFSTAGGLTITGNTIGANASGTTALANGGAGISVDDNAFVTIGGTSVGAANIIRNNTGAGIAVTGANANVSARGNAVFSNGGLGIDLGTAGLTLNDAGDPDAGPNGLQNFPVITSAAAGATTTVSGSFNGFASTAFTLDFYASTTGDPSSYGEGQRHLGSTVVNTNASGNATFTNVVLAGASAGGEIVSATATDPRGNTSEFALNATASGSTAPTVLSTLVNNSASNQRSRVSSLAVTFSTAVTFAGAVANAFTLTRTGGGAIGGFTATASLNGLGQTVVVLDGFTGAETAFGSLNDGNYVLTALANQISAGGTPMAANYVFGAVQSDRFYRFYGDITGDRRVDIADFGFFSAGYLQGPGANVPSLDYNQDGRLDITDFGQFSVRFFTSLP